MANPNGPPRDPDALARMNRAFCHFKDTVEKSDARRFNNTKLKDVWEASRAIERKLAADGESRALARIDPLLKGLEHYSSIVETLFGSTHYLAWIWVRSFMALRSIMLTLRLGSNQAVSQGRLTSVYVHWLMLTHGCGRSPASISLRSKS